MESAASASLLWDMPSLGLGHSALKGVWLEGKGTGQGWGEGRSQDLASEGGWTLSAAGCRAGGQEGSGRASWRIRVGWAGSRLPSCPPEPCVDLGSLWEDSRNSSCSDKNRLLRRAWGLASCSRCPPGLARVGAPGKGGTVLLGPRSAA